jgi:GNAT superfamily N-acetyltransferase
MIPSAEVVDADDDRFAELADWIASASDVGRSSTGIHLPARMEANSFAVQLPDDDTMVGGALVEVFADQTAQVGAVRLASGVEPTASEALFRRLAAESARRRARLVIIYAVREDASIQASLLAAGFRRTHDLLVMSAPTPSLAPGISQGDWSYRPYLRAAAVDFQQLFQRTQENTLDFPDLSTECPPEKSLERFVQAGGCGERLWFVVQHRGQPAGCLLMADHPELNQCELVYLGLCPGFRGMGGGQRIVAYALQQAGQRGRRITIAGVDAQNDPAIAAYALNGFDPIARRCVFFCREPETETVSH